MIDRELLESRVAALADDRSSGASELARQALASLASFVEQSEARDVAELRRSAGRLAEALESARPSMASVAGLVSRWRRQLVVHDGASLAEERGRLAESARDLVSLSRSAVAAVAREAAALVPTGATLLTLSRSSTLVEIFRRTAGRDVDVMVSESRPLMEGRTLAAELGEMGIPVRLITEAQLGVFAGEADIAIVGADAVLADGSLVNKAGTYLLALAASEADVPFWVCAESFKRSPMGLEEFHLEEGSEEDLGAPHLERVKARNVVFDITPSRLVTRWIDEHGSTLGHPR